MRFIFRTLLICTVLLLSGCEVLELRKLLKFDALECSKIEDVERAAELIDIVHSQHGDRQNEYFYYVAYACGDDFDRVSYELDPDRPRDLIIVDGGSEYFIDRRSGRIVFERYQG